MGPPLLATAWGLSSTEQVWAGPSPCLLALRNPALVAEELAWTAARFPGRVGAALAPGYAQTISTCSMSPSRTGPGGLGKVPDTFFMRSPSVKDHGKSSLVITGIPHPGATR
jgi:hypothetical protein